MLLVKDIIAKMSPQYRVCLLLQYHWGFKQREIAKRLNISEKTVSTNVSRAHKQLNRIYLTGQVLGELPAGTEVPMSPEEWEESNLNRPAISPSALQPSIEPRPARISDIDFLKGPSPRLQQLWEEEDRNGSSR